MAEDRFREIEEFSKEVVHSHEEDLVVPDFYVPNWPDVLAGMTVGLSERRVLLPFRYKDSGMYGLQQTKVINLKVSILEGGTIRFSVENAQGLINKINRKLAGFFYLDLGSRAEYSSRCLKHKNTWASYITLPTFPYDKSQSSCTCRANDCQKCITCNHAKLCALFLFKEYKDEIVVRIMDRLERQKKDDKNVREAFKDAIRPFVPYIIADELRE